MALRKPSILVLMSAPRTYRAAEHGRAGKEQAENSQDQQSVGRVLGAHHGSVFRREGARDEPHGFVRHHHCRKISGLQSFARPHMTAVAAAGHEPVDIDDVHWIYIFYHWDPHHDLISVLRMMAFITRYDIEIAVAVLFFVGCATIALHGSWT
jgi:hypothetical protein